MDRDRIWQWFYYQHQLTMKKKKCLVLDSKPCLFYINYGWRGLIFCFQKRVQSKIFQARFRAFKVCWFNFFIQTVLYQFWKLSSCFQKTFTKWCYQTDSSSSKKHCVMAFLKVLPKRFTRFWAQLFLYSENCKTKSKHLPNRSMLNFNENIVVFTWIPFDL